MKTVIIHAESLLQCVACLNCCQFILVVGADTEKKLEHEDSTSLNVCSL